MAEDSAFQSAAKADASADGDAGRKEPRNPPAKLFPPRDAGSLCMNWGLSLLPCRTGVNP